jgi:hypothetical protein
MPATAAVSPQPVTLSCFCEQVEQVSVGRARANICVLLAGNWLQEMKVACQPAATKEFRALTR